MVHGLAAGLLFLRVVCFGRRCCDAASIWVWVRVCQNGLAVWEAVCVLRGGLCARIGRLHESVFVCGVAGKLNQFSTNSWLLC